MNNINDVINLCQVDLSGEMGSMAFSTKMRYRLITYGVEGYHDLALLANPQVSVHYFKPNAAGLAALPPDFEFYTKVAIVICGVSYTLTRNNNIPLPKLQCGIETPQQLTTCNGDPSTFGDQGFNWVSHYRGGQYVGEYYSMGGGWNSSGYFRINHKDREIVLQDVPTGAEFVMEYVSNGSDGGSTLIERKAIKPIRAYIHHQLKEYSKAPLNAKARAEATYLKEFQKYKKIVTGVTIEEFLDKMYAGFTPGLKGVARYG